MSVYRNLLLVAGISLIAATSQAATTIITESDISRQPENTTPHRNWVLYTRNAGDGAFRNGPDTPPLGTGSL